MSCLPLEDGGFVCGNFAPLTHEKPEGYDEAYKILREPPEWMLKERPKLGKATCDCKEIEEHFQPWYGFSWYHSRECAIAKHLKRYPGIENFMWDRDPMCIGFSD